jgi:N-acetylglucosaminyldiphosphoundecaprenol N-acetyl-beta-D-mannosaminyltransferase
MYRTSFIGYPVDSLTSQEVISFVERTICNEACHFIGVQNANKMYLSDKYPEVKEILNRAGLILPENAINMGMTLLGRPLPERNIGGVVVMKRLLRLADERGLSVYLLGSSEDTLRVLVKRINTDYPGVRLVGYRNGYFQGREAEAIVKMISGCSPNLLFVGMGSPKQEFFIGRNLEKLNANICLGAGGSFKALAGLEKPAPKWTKYGLEWLYRSMYDPRKFKRYLVVNSYFVLRLLSYAIGEKCFGAHPSIND